MYVTTYSIFQNIKIKHPLEQLCIYQAASPLTDSKYQTKVGNIIKNRVSQLALF